MRIVRLLLASISIAALFVLPASLAIAQDSIVKVRQVCGTEPLCHESLASVQAWLLTRVPSATDPVLVDLGPGIWTGPWVCNGAGGITVRGGGRDTTYIRGTNGPAASITGCDPISFQDVTLDSNTVAVEWTGAGRSTWDDVDLTSTGATTPSGAANLAWRDADCQAGHPIAQHAFFGVHAIAVANAASDASNRGVFSFACSNVTFYSGEITWKAAGLQGTALGVDAAGVRLREGASFEAYSAALRNLYIDATGAAPTGTFQAVLAEGTATHPATFDLHGGIVNLTATGTILPPAATVLTARDQATIRTMGSAFAVNIPTSLAATTSRVATSGSGTIIAPILWQSGTTPPATASETDSLGGIDGDDLFVETDCASDGDCSAGTEAHLMVYNAQLCGASDPWFDTATGRCRGDTNEIIEPYLQDLDARVTAIEAGLGL